MDPTTRQEENSETAQNRGPQPNRTEVYKPEIWPLSKTIILSTEKEPIDPTTMVKGLRQEENRCTISYQERISDTKGTTLIHN